MEASLNECVAEITQLATTKGIAGLKIAAESVHIYSGSCWNERPSGVEVTGTYESSKEADKEEFEKKANEILGAKSINCEVELKPKLDGMKFPMIKQAKAVVADNPTEQEVAPKDGEVTLFDFWATWCGPCQGPMAHNQEMLVKHPEWAGKARIVGVSIDDEIDAPKKRVTEKGWTKVDHYWVAGGWSSSVCKAFAIHGIPFCVLVDQAGIVKLAGHPASMKLEENIPKLIQGETLPAEKEEEDEDGPALKDPNYQQTANKVDLEAFVQSHKTELEGVNNPLIASVYKKAAKEGKMMLASSFVLIRFTWMTKNKAVADKLKADFAAAFESKITHRVQEREIVTATLEFGSKCSKCSKDLGTCDQYLCVECKPLQYFCLDCIDSHKDPKSVADLGHPHGLYYIQKTSIPCMDAVRFCNLKATEGEHTERNYGGYGCDGCGCRPIIGSHWKCVICADVDICDKCMASYKNPADPEHNAVIEKAKGVGHDMNTHVYGREDFYGLIDFRGAH